MPRNTTQPLAGGPEGSFPSPPDRAMWWPCRGRLMSRILALMLRRLRRYHLGHRRAWVRTRWPTTIGMPTPRTDGLVASRAKSTSTRVRHRQPDRVQPLQIWSRPGSTASRSITSNVATSARVASGFAVATTHPGIDY